MNNHFDAKDWIKKYFGLTEISKTFDNTNNSLEFIWVWSIFEHKYLRNSNSSQGYNEQLICIAKLIPENMISIDTIYGYFHNRYFQKSKTTRFFNNLNFKTKWQKKTKEILMKIQPTFSEKLSLIFLVIYKFRCNLFHGRKDPLLWKNFDKTFFQINRFLASFLDTKWDPADKKVPE